MAPSKPSNATIQNCRPVPRCSRGVATASRLIVAKKMTNIITAINRWGGLQAVRSTPKMACHSASPGIDDKT